MFIDSLQEKMTVGRKEIPAIFEPNIIRPDGILPLCYSYDLLCHVVIKLGSLWHALCQIDLKEPVETAATHSLNQNVRSENIWCTDLQSPPCHFSS